MKGLFGTVLPSHEGTSPRTPEETTRSSQSTSGPNRETTRSSQSTSGPYHLSGQLEEDSPTRADSIFPDTTIPMLAQPAPTLSGRKKVILRPPRESQQGAEPTAQIPEPTTETISERGPRAPRTIPRDTVQLLDDILERFRRGEIEKHAALFDVFGEISRSGATTTARSMAQKQWTAAIDQTADSVDEASRRGGHSRGFGLGDVGSPIYDLSDPSQQILRPRKRRRDEDELESEHEDEGDDGGSELGGIKQRFDETHLPWHKRDIAAQASANPIITENRRLLAFYAQNIPRVKQNVILSPTAPPGIPPSEIENALRGQPLNLEILFSSLYHVRPAKENVGRIGDTEIRFDATKPARTIKSASDWTAAWYPARKLYSFLFPQRADEAMAYGDYISGMFASRVPSSHSRIILYDKGVRNLVQGGQRHTLTDYSSFQDIFAATIQADGIEYNNLPAFSKKSPKSGQSTATCNRFNIGNCPNSSETCTYRHICSICRQRGHGKGSCSSRERLEARPTA